MDQKMITEFKKWFEQFSGVLIAFSGGIDSALVLFLDRKYLGKRNAIGIIANSESLKSSDYQLAVDFAQKNDITTIRNSKLHQVVGVSSKSDSGIQCLICNTSLSKFRVCQSVVSFTKDGILVNQKILKTLFSNIGDELRIFIL